MLTRGYYNVFPLFYSHSGILYFGQVFGFCVVVKLVKAVVAIAGENTEINIVCVQHAHLGKTYKSASEIHIEWICITSHHCFTCTSHDHISCF